LALPRFALFPRLLCRSLAFARSFGTPPDPSKRPGLGSVGCSEKREAGSEGESIVVPRLPLPLKPLLNSTRPAFARQTTVFNFQFFIFILNSDAPHRSQARTALKEEQSAPLLRPPRRMRLGRAYASIRRTQSLASIAGLGVRAKSYFWSGGSQR
jgi:hypothetical protein